MHGLSYFVEATEMKAAYRYFEMPLPSISALSVAMHTASREYVGRNVGLQRLTDDIEEYFQNSGYKTQRGDQEKTHVVQAQKAGIVRDLAAADRAFTVVVAGEPDKLKVSIGVGKWLQNLGVSVLEALLVTPLLLFLEIPVSLWSYEIEGKLWQFIDKQVELSSS